MPPLRIVIDCRKLADRGIGGYVEGLLRGIAADGRGHHYTLLARPGAEGELTALLPGATVVPESAPRYSLRELVTPALRARRLGADVYHAPHYTLPVAAPGARVTTVHDLIHLRVPDAAPRPRVLARAYARAVIGHAVRASTRLIAVSAHTRRDVVAAWPQAAAKTQVIPSAVPERFHRPPSPEAVEAFRAARGLGEEAILFVGGSRPHKNLAAALRACAALAPRHPALRLAVAGADGRGTIVPTGVPADRVVWLPNLTDDEMPLLYRAARLLLFPSLYEGFGLPPLEAMAVGTPVVASNRTALPETAGDAALLVDPDDSAAVAEACDRMLADAAFAAALIERGRRHAAQFTPLRLARATLDVYEEAARVRGARRLH